MNAAIAGLFIYPVKGCRGIPLQHARIEPRGLQHDRRWMLVDGRGRFVSQRELPALARLGADVVAGRLRLKLPSGIEVELPEGAGGERLPVTIWRDEVLAEAPSAEADAALSSAFGKPMRLVRFIDGERRACDADFAPTGSHTGFSDGFPVLVTTEDSLVEVNEALLERGAEPVPMSRFRPNIVLSGVRRRAEDEAGSLRLAGGRELLFVKICDRCIVTTVDQESGVRQGPEPVATLARIRRNPRTGGVTFGQNALLAPPDEGFEVALGESATLAA